MTAERRQNEVLWKALARWHASQPALANESIRYVKFAVFVRQFSHG